MTVDLNALMTVLFVAGGGGAVASVLSVVKTLRGGKIEKEETLIRRLDEDNRKQQALREQAERAKDEAEAEAEAYRKQRNQTREELARLRWWVMEQGLNPPRFGDDNEK